MDNIKNMKKKATEQEQIFANNISDTGFAEQHVWCNCRC